MQIFAFLINTKGSVAFGISLIEEAKLKLTNA